MFQNIFYDFVFHSRPITLFEQFLLFIDQLVVKNPDRNTVYNSWFDKVINIVTDADWLSLEMQNTSLDIWHTRREKAGFSYNLTSTESIRHLLKGALKQLKTE